MRMAITSNSGKKDIHTFGLKCQEVSSTLDIVSVCKQ